MVEPTRLELRMLRGSVGVVRRFVVTLDGKRVARVRPGRSVVLELAAGDHELGARIDWHRGSTMLHLSAGELTRVDIDYIQLITDRYWRPTRPFAFTVRRGT